MDSFIYEYDTQLKEEHRHPETGKFAAIYALVCELNKTILVGSSEHVRERFVQHKRILKRGKHGNPHQQRIYDKYKVIHFRILENLLGDISGPTLVKHETEWIERMRDKNSGYKCINIVKPVDAWTKRAPGKPWTVEQREFFKEQRKTKNYDHLRTPEHRQRVSVITKGKKRTQQTKDRMSKAMKARTFEMEMIYTVQTQENEILTITGWHPLKKHFKEYNQHLHYHKRIHVAQLVKYKEWNGVRILRMVKHIFGGKEEKYIIKYQDPLYVPVELPAVTC